MNSVKLTVSAILLLVCLCCAQQQDTIVIDTRVDGRYVPFGLCLQDDWNWYRFAYIDNGTNEWQEMTEIKWQPCGVYLYGWFTIGRKMKIILIRGYR